MYTECYSHTTASNGCKDAKVAPCVQKGDILRYSNDNWYVLNDNALGVAKYAPLYVKSVPFSTPHHLVESEKFNIQYTNPAKITEVANKLRWYRYHNSLLQSEVADMIGVSRSTYIHYEEAERDYYPINHIQRLAALYNISVTDLLDEYNTFLYCDQGKQIQAMRHSLNMTQREYAKALGVPIGTLKKWEQNQARIYKSSWERYFKLPKN